MHEEGSDCEEEEEIVENGGMWKLRSPSKKRGNHMGVSYIKIREY